jgi:hypothetical protein
VRTNTFRFPFCVVKEERTERKDLGTILALDRGNLTVKRASEKGKGFRCI